MPSPRRGGSVPLRRRRRCRLFRASELPPQPIVPDSDSSWADTSDTSIASSSSDSGNSNCAVASTTPGGSRCLRPGVSSSSLCHLSSSSSEDDDDDDDGDDGDASGDEDEGSPRGEPLEKRVRSGRSSSRHGARERGGSVICRYCGKRGYGVMKMVMSCNCRDAAAAAQVLRNLPSRPILYLVQDVSSPPSPADTSVSPCPRYKWSPCSSDSSPSSSSTLSDGGTSSSGEDADVECKEVVCPLQLQHRGSHVAVR